MSKPERSTGKAEYGFGYYFSRFANNVSMVLKGSEKLPEINVFK